MLTIDHSTCIGCGKYVKECFGFHIYMKEDKVMGHPAVSYERSVPRKEAVVEWK